MDEDGKLKFATDYLKSLFEASTTLNADRSLAGIMPCIREDMNEALMKVFQKEELKTALKSMSPLKALGENGFFDLFSRNISI